MAIKSKHANRIIMTIFFIIDKVSFSVLFYKIEPYFYSFNSFGILGIKVEKKWDNAGCGTLKLV